MASFSFSSSSSASEFGVNFEPQQVVQEAPVPNSPLISFNNEMNALRVECENLEAQLKHVVANSADIQPVMLAVSQTVFKTNHLLSIFLRNFYYPLKWSRLHRKKERMEILDYVQFWHREFLRYVRFLSGFPFQVPQVQETLKSMKSSLVYNSMVMNLQPPRVIKRNKLSNTSLRILLNNEQQNGIGAGNDQSSSYRTFILNEEETTKLFQNWQAGNLHPSSTPPSVLLNLQEIQNILSSRKKTRTPSGELDPTNPSFLGLKIDSSEKGGEMRKFCLLYLKSVEVDGVAMETWCISLPFVLIAADNQKCPAHASIFWDNYFKKAGNWLPFQVKEETNWKDLSLALIDYFKSETETEWSLTPQNLKYIGRKIFKTDDFHDNTVVSRKDVCYVVYGCKIKENIMTNWRWLFSIVKLIKKQLAPFWDSGAIIGFIDRFEAENLIRSKDRGTFLIRFSDNSPGGVSYTVAIAPTPFETARGFKSGAQSVAPLTDAKDLEGLTNLRLLSLDQRLMTSPMFTHVLYLEPSFNYQEVLKPKEEKFTRPSAQDAEKEAVENPNPNPNATKYVPPILMVADDPTSFQIQPQTTLKSEPGTEAVNGQGRVDDVHNLVSSTSHLQNPLQTPYFTNEWESSNLNSSHNQIQYQYQYQYQNHHGNPLEEFDWTPQSSLFDNASTYHHNNNNNQLLFGSFTQMQTESSQLLQNF